MKNKRIEYFISFLNKEYGEEKTNNIKIEAYKIYSSLCNQYKNDSKKMKKQTEGDMYPIISLYKAMIESGISKLDAFNFLDKNNYNRKLKEAKQMSKILKFFGLYKLYPSIFKKVTLSSFGEDIGFKPEFVIANKKRCKFNMKKCLFCDRCKEIGCPELVLAFCHTDDAFNDNLHEKIIWSRSGTLAEGKECCDFDVYLKK